MTIYIVSIKYQELKASYVSEAEILANAENADDAMFIAQQLFKRYSSSFITHHKVISTIAKKIEFPCIIKT